MWGTAEEREAFCKEFNVSSEKLRASCLTWEELERIAEDFESKRSGHQDTVRLCADALQQCPGVHSLRFRVKETAHLIEKIIRKNPECLKSGDSLSVSNYERKLTDLMGIRLLVLFKQDWQGIHEKILADYGEALWEPPFAYLREGDDDSLYREKKIEIRKEKPYRSVHYVIRSGGGLGIEIQVRTLYEEAWSEIDHKLRYPYNLTNRMLTNYLNMMNRLTGMGDEMGAFIREYIRIFDQGLREGGADENEVYSFILQKIEACDNEEVRQAIVDKIRRADSYREMKKMSDLLNDLLGHQF